MTATMAEPPQAITKVAVLAVNGDVRDLRILRVLFSGSSWDLETAGTLADAIQKLSRSRLSVVLCGNQLPDGDWKDLLRATKAIEHPPVVIVMSRQADDQLWYESLECGAFNVLPFPARPGEVFRALNDAWRHWRGCEQRSPEKHCVSKCRA